MASPPTHHATPPNVSNSVVLVVEDDPGAQEGIGLLLRSAGFQFMIFSSAQEFLDARLPNTLRCLVTDVRLPQVSGLDLQNELARRGERIPIIFMTGHGDIPMSVRAMKAGAVDFLAKPFRDQDLLDAICAAFAEDKVRREADGERQQALQRYKALTPREREVMELVTRGLMNKQVAGELGLSEITVKLHRSSLMKKMGIRSLAELVRTADALHAAASPPTSV